MKPEKKQQLAREYSETFFRSDIIRSYVENAFVAAINVVEEDMKHMEDRLRYLKSVKQSQLKRIEELKEDKVRIMCERDSLRSESHIEIESLRAELAKAQNPWISVEERLPEKDEFVFTLEHKDSIDRHGDYAISQYLGNNRWWQEDGDYSIEFTGGVTHWMPIPELQPQTPPQP